MTSSTFSLIPSRRRIVSLVPSLTETLVHLGLRSELVACTSFCVDPPDLHRDVTIVGGTKDFDVEKILALHPTHIIANQEENPREPIEVLASRVPTLVSFPKGPADVPAMLRDMGRFLECSDVAEQLSQAIEAQLMSCKQTNDAPEHRVRFLYLIWREPYMAAGPDTYISRLLECAGWENAYQGTERYPALSSAEIATLGVDEILLSSEPFPFRNRHAQKLRDDGIRHGSMSKIDGKTCSWFGWRTLPALEFIREVRGGRRNLDFIRSVPSV